MKYSYVFATMNSEVLFARIAHIHAHTETNKEHYSFGTIYNKHGWSRPESIVTLAIPVYTLSGE